LIFRKEIYAFACFFGALVYLIMEYFYPIKELNMFVSILVVIAIRVLSIKNKWSIPFNPISRK